MNETRKIVLITGAAKRIGHIIALEMAKTGWDIAIHYGKSKQEADETAKLVKAMGQEAICIEADLAQESEVEQILPTCIEQLGLPDCIVNNASIFEYDDASTFQYQKLTQHMAVNLAAPTLLTKMFAQYLKDEQQKAINLLKQLTSLSSDKTIETSPLEAIVDFLTHRCQ